MIRPVLLIFVSLLAACSSTSLTYRIDVRQGNMVTQEMAAQLKMGQTKDQVRFILGTPLIADMFHADRWDFVYRFRPGNDYSDVEQRHLSVFFEKGKLVGVGGDVLALEGNAATATKSTPRVIDIAPAGGSTN